MTAPAPQCQPTTTELVAKLIGGMGFESDVAHHLTEIVKLSLEEGKAAGRDEASDEIKRLNLELIAARPLYSRRQIEEQLAAAKSRIEELEGLGRFLVARLEEFDPGDEEPEREYHGHVAPALARFRGALEAKP